MRVPSSTPAGMLTESVRSLVLRPVPAHFSHGVSIAAVRASIVDASAKKGRIEILTHEAEEFLARIKPRRGQIKATLTNQEFICGNDGRDSTLDNAMSQCEAFGLSPAAAAREVVRVMAVVDQWQAHFAAAGVSARDVATLAEHIDSDALLEERRRFDPARHESAKAGRRRTGPFRGG